MPGPYDYGSLVGPIGDPGAAFQQGINGAQVQQQNALKLQQQQAAMAAAQQQQQQYQAALQEALNRPTPRSFANLALINPEAHEAIKKSWDMLDQDTQNTALRDLSGVYGFATSGDSAGAKKLIQNHIDADKKAGHDTSQYDGMLSLIDEGPEGLKKVAGVAGILLSSAKPDKFAETFKNVGEDERADAINPGLVKKGIADASKATTEAQMAPQVIASDLASEASTRARQAAQTAIENANVSLGWEKLALDKDALATNTQLKLQELAQTGQAVTGASLDELTKSVASSQTSQALANRAKGLASAIETAGSRGGVGSGWAEWLKSQTGNQDAVSVLRNEYSRLSNSIAVKNLPPGSASDKDVAFALKGFPAASTQPEFIAQFLRGVAKLQTLSAAADDRKANWISTNGNLGTAKRDLDVGGMRVPAGTTFGEFNKNAVKVDAKGELPQRGYLEKYGR